MYGSNHADQTAFKFNVYVRDGEAGKIIGKNACGLKDLQRRFGCRVTVQSRDGSEDQTHLRLCTITGPTLESVGLCRNAVCDFVDFAKCGDTNVILKNNVMPPSPMDQGVLIATPANHGVFQTQQQAMNSAFDRVFEQFFFQI